MNALTLKAILVQELASLGLPADDAGRNAPGKRYTQWAKDLPCFGLRSYSSGRKVYVVQARSEGRNRTLTIGNARVLSRAQALDVARRILLRMQTGESHGDDKVVTRRMPLYEQFLQEFWDKISPRWKASTLSRNAYYRNHLTGAFPRRFLDKIEVADVARWFAAITANSGPAAANRALELLCALFNKAEAWGVLPGRANPCTEIKRHRLHKHQCLLTADELARFGQALADLEAVAPMQVAAIKLVALTGCRKSEICGLGWDEVKGRRLLLHDAKTGPRTVWMGAEAEGVLSSIARHPTVPWVFRIGDRQLTVASLDGVFRKARLAAGLSHVRMHDLRHNFASHAATMSETLPMIGKLLGHASLQMTARYAHLDDEAVISANDAIGQLLVRMTGEGQAVR
ncbi:site-specific integrase [Novosphingobium sp. JCM 18896]|uniref:site-specific integrase n=1 Tax=Novosphingobium sp. JCM 18896 TaxID=2989731 RepID=UPI0022231F79|nr:site-specific integrase [Novosphingobium sp. JCM 18896]MCW1432011.1 site-specific integrase [Novosphingobium sp. JCM 18896]